MTAAMTRPLWGWIVPARGLLALVMLAGGMVLLLCAGESSGDPPTPPQLVIDPNTAPPAVLGALPKLGPTLVTRIVEARAEAPFTTLDDLDRRVRGIGPATIAALRPYLHIGPIPATDPPVAPASSARMAHNFR